MKVRKYRVVIFMLLMFIITLVCISKLEVVTLEKYELFTAERQGEVNTTDYDTENTIRLKLLSIDGNIILISQIERKKIGDLEWYRGGFNATIDYVKNLNVSMQEVLEGTRGVTLTYSFEDNNTIVTRLKIFYWILTLPDDSVSRELFEPNESWLDLEGNVMLEKMIPLFLDEGYTIIDN